MSHVAKNPARKSQTLVYRPDDVTSINTRFDGETFWLTREEIASLFGRDVSTVRKHLENAQLEELFGMAVWANFAHTASDGKTYAVKCFNLDAILSVGYRVKSPRGVQFRRWANNVIKDRIRNQDAASAVVPCVKSDCAHCMFAFFNPTSDDGNRIECHVARPTRTGFPPVRTNDFCSQHVNRATGEKTYAKFLTVNSVIC